MKNILRLARDIKDLNKDPLDKEGIFYSHDENELNKGYALIIGQSGTPYKHGFCLFSFTFPEDYPYTPPTVKFESGNNIVRFHPNLYKNRKVCLSILNTWNGDPWSSCQTIRSVLLTISTILTKDPLLHEPHVREDHRDFKKYTLAIEYENLKVMSYERGKSIINNTQVGPFYIFRSIVLDYLNNNFSTIIDDINTKRKTISNSKINIGIYGFTSDINYKELLDNYKLLKSEVKKIEIIES